MTGEQPHGNGRPLPAWAPGAAVRYAAGESLREITATMDGVTLAQVTGALRKAGVTFRGREEAKKLRRDRTRAERARMLRSIL